MSLLAQDPNERYKVRPRTVNPKADRQRKARDWTTDINDQDSAGQAPPAPPTAKVPEKVMVPVPVPTPVAGLTTPPPPVPVDQSAPAPPQRYKINMAGTTPPPGPMTPPQIAQTTPSPMQSEVTQPFYPQTPRPGDTATAPVVAGQTQAPADDVPQYMKDLAAAHAQTLSDEATPVEKEKWWKSGLKMLAYGARDMPPAHDWAEFAYGAGRAAGSGAAGVANRRLPGEIQKRYRVAADQAREAEAQKNAQIGSTVDSKANATKVRNARLNRDLSKDEAAKVQNERKSIAADLRRLPYIDPKNPVHAKILARAAANGMDIDPESFGKGKTRPRMTVLDDDGVTKHIFEKDPEKGWVPVSIDGKDAVAGLAEKRNPLTGESYSSEQRRAFERQKFDFTKVEAGIHDNQRERALALQSKGMDIRVAQGQAEVDAIDNVLPDLETQLNTTDDEVIRSQIQRAITTLKDRRGRAAGAAGVPGVGTAPAKTYPHTEAEARAKAANLPPALVEEYLKRAREQGLIPPQ